MKRIGCGIHLTLSHDIFKIEPPTALQACKFLGGSREHLTGLVYLEVSHLESVCPRQL